MLGLLAAALGYGRHDAEAHDALSAGVLIAVCGHGARRVADDYRTVQTIQPLQHEAFPTRGHALASARRLHTMTGWRQHIEDGLWRVFVTSAGTPLDGLAMALHQPAFNLCLGRREHPIALPLDPRLIDGGLTEGLSSYPPTPSLPGLWIADRVCRTGGDLWWDPGFPGAPAGRGRTVVDQPVDRARWRFRPREQRWGALADVAVQAPVVPQPAASFFDDAGDAP